MSKSLKMQKINEDSSLEIQSRYMFFIQEVMASVANSMPPRVSQVVNFDNCCFIKMISGCAEGMFVGLPGSNHGSYDLL